MNTVSTYRLDSNTTNLLVTGLTDKYTYKIFVDAFNKDSTFSAHSNEFLIIPDLPKRPDYNYIDYVTVNHNNGSVNINCLVDNTAIIDYYDVFRSVGFNNDFSKIGIVPFDGSCLLYTSPSPRDGLLSRMPSSA